MTYLDIDSAEGLNEEFLRECQKVNAVPLPILSMIKSQKLELNCSLTPNISQSISNMCPVLIYIYIYIEIFKLYNTNKFK